MCSLDIRQYSLSPSDVSEPQVTSVKIPMTKRVDGVHTAVQVRGDTIALVVIPTTRVDLGYSAVSFALQVIFIDRPSFSPFAVSVATIQLGHDQVQADALS